MRAGKTTRVPLDTPNKVSERLINGAKTLVVVNYSSTTVHEQTILRSLARRSFCARGDQVASRAVTPAGCATFGYVEYPPAPPGLTTPVGVTAAQEGNTLPISRPALIMQAPSLPWPFTVTSADVTTIGTPLGIGNSVTLRSIVAVVPASGSLQEVLLTYGSYIGNAGVSCQLVCWSSCRCRP